MMVRISKVEIWPNTDSNIIILKEINGNRDLSRKELRGFLRKKDANEVPRKDFWSPIYL